MYYDKLVRDKIPEIINNNGEIAFTKKLNNYEFTYYLDELLEEAYKKRETKGGFSKQLLLIKTEKK